MFTERGVYEPRTVREPFTPFESEP
jgi:hypothetical protein